MCIKAGVDELDSVKNLMGMALKAVVAEALCVDLDDVAEEAHLVEDLHMGAAEAAVLHELIADTFDGLSINPAETPTYAALLERVVLNEFREAERARECGLAA